MLLFQWNALRIGDRVMVHDDLDHACGLHAGSVRLVQTRQHGANDVGIRLDDRAAELVRPRRHAAHLVPIDTTIPCWRCDALSGSSTDGDHVVAA